MPRSESRKIENISDDYKEYLSQLLTLSQMLNSSLKLDEVLNMTMDLVVDFVKAERGFIMLYNEDEELELKAYENVDPDLIKEHKDISHTILNASAKEGKDVLSVNAQRDPRFKNLESVMLTGMRSVMSVPLKVKDRIIGVVYLDNRIEEGMFKERHLNMLSAFSNQAAVAIDNARLYENLVRSYDERFELIHELHQQEKMRLASEEANRLKSEFVSIVSHELRSPMTVIKTYTSALHIDGASGKNSISKEQTFDIYKTIDQEVDRLISMINKMLDISRIDAGKPLKMDWRECDIIPFIRNLLKIQRTSKFYRKKHRIIENIPSNLPKLRCSQEELSQIISNLVENALKYSPDGGDVIVSVKSEPEWIVFSIKDQGMGISGENQEKLFRKFERFDKGSKRTIPGTGLGLYLIKNLIDLHGGNVQVKSKLGEGSEFIVSIPREIK
ncbi:MAG: GAF domain-containing sensor histidine kinase [Candidatus Eremiobacteraeota bacterium]|nr:GAF domain-containing sensor histidine kinase [Candidatus Eremiobacteraeota bacterium]